MGDWSSFGKTLVSVGIFLAVLGLVIWGLGKFLGIGRLPGDIYYSKGNFTIYFPIVTSIIISIILTVILNLFFKR
ncbi:MAG: hypothetical protein JM58_07905 [Peptococcaceae bacterium BICA1-8]|nr:MAG: hypothetical protein JM58_07905 [Peptococcaceae bacterium BICA1-8]